MPTTFDLVDHAPWSSRRPGASRPPSLTCALAVTEGLNTGAGMNFTLRVNKMALAPPAA
jgi:hypothetical protein